MLKGGVSPGKQLMPSIWLASYTNLMLSSFVAFAFMAARKHHEQLHL